jgi:hypothetical protein
MDSIDSFYVAAELDIGGPRFYFRAVRCPFHDECSKNAWKKANTTSFLNREAVHTGVFEHLMKSGRHWKPYSEAKEAADSCEVEVVEETETQRAQYRDQIDKIAERKRKRSDIPDRGKRDDVKGEGKGKTSKDKTNRGGGAEASMSSSSLAEVATDESQTVARQPLNSQNLGLLIDALHRSTAALDDLTAMTQRAAATPPILRSSERTRRSKRLHVHLQVRREEVRWEVRLDRGGSDERR